MTIDSIRERTYILQKRWYEYHNKKVCDILFQQLTTDIVFSLDEKLPEYLEKR